MEMRLLKYFVAVADAGSLTAGAEAVRISQPAVSRQLRSLERELGAELFVRGHGALQLTRAGERMLEVARDLIRREQSARLVLSTDGTREPLGVPGLTVVAPLATLHDMVAPMLARRGEALPLLDGVEAEPATVFDQARHLGADLGLSTVPPPAGWAARRLPQIPLYAQVRPDDPRAQAPSVSLESLLDETLFVMNRTNMARLVVDQALADLTRLPAHVIEMRSSLLAQGHAAAGRGVALLTNWPRFDLVCVPVTADGQAMTVDCYAGWDPTHYAVDVLVALVDEIEHFTQDVHLIPRA